MRRSAAPSQLGLANKRPRFAPPFANKATTITNSQQGVAKQINPEQNRTKTDVLHLIQNKSTVDCKSGSTGTPAAGSSQPKLRRPFQSPFSKTTSNEILCEKSYSPCTTEEKVVNECNIQKARSPESANPNSVAIESSHCKSLNTDDTASLTVNDQKVLSDSKNIPFVRRKTGLHRSTFRQPVLQKSQSENTNVGASPDQSNDEDAVKSHYYNVMW